MPANSPGVAAAGRGARLPDTIAGREVARATRNSLIAHAIFLALLLWLSGELWQDVHNLLKSPWEPTAKALTVAQNPERLSRSRVRIHAVDAVAAGEKGERDQDSGQETVVATYLLVPVADRLLVVEAGPDQGGGPQEFLGFLEPLEGEVIANLFSEPKVRRALLPFKLNTRKGSSEIWIAAALVLAGAVWSIWRLRLALDRRGDPILHPIVTRLAAYGNALDLARSVDEDFGEDPPIKLLKAQLGASFLLHRTIFDTMILPDSALVWAYKKVTKKSVNFIPVGKDYHLVICGASGETIELQGDEAGVNQGLEKLGEQFPWLPLGYTQERATLVAKDRAQWAKAVADRRRQWAEELIKKVAG